MSDNNILFLLNPHSNEGGAKGKWQACAKRYSILPRNPLEVTVASDFTKIINQHKPKIIAIAGGDGTINAVCSAVLKMQQKPLVAILPFGFGNALAYCLG